jgi:branched-chain amino acid transport system permease protein
MTEPLQYLVIGILTGGVYALLASGLTLIFGVLRVVNFAHADFMMLAMFAGYALWAGPGIDPFIAVPAVFVAFFLVGAAFHRTLVRRVMGHRENQDAQVILTLGVGLILQNVMVIAFSTEARTIDPAYLDGGFHVGGVFVDVAHLLAFGLSVAVAGGLYVFLQRTATGRTIRGTAEDWEAATYMGIDIDRAYRIAFGVGIGLTAIGGIALATFQTFNPFVGLDFFIIMFAAVVLGGLGSVPGAFVGGIVMGVVQSVSQLWSSASLADVWVFAIFLLVLVVRPQGLLGKAQRAI